MAIRQKVKYVNDILQALLTARKRKWDDDEAVRLERESELLRYVKGLIEAERKRQLEDADDDQEKIDEVNYLTVNGSEHRMHTRYSKLISFGIAG